MTIDDLAVGVGAVDVTAAAGQLVAGLMARPWGEVSCSVYETGRLVTLAPWLLGHAERVGYLLAEQREDGGWGGGPEGYRLVPTLSATEALLAELRSGVAAGADSSSLTRAVVGGLGWLSRWLGDPGDRALGSVADAAGTLPDMPAIELIVPALVALINERLRELRETGPAGADLPVTRLGLPSGMSDTKITMIRAALESGVAVPEKLLHALEVAGDAAGSAPAVHPTAAGTVGASPAAAAAWLRGRAAADDPFHPVRRHLEAVARRYGGPVPVGLPITLFERSWVLSWLARAGVPFEVPPEMIVDLRTAIGPVGTSTGAGLPPDADTTSVVLYALALLGAPLEPESLLAYEADTCFHTWPGEEGFSTSVNAHVLDAFGQYVARYPEAGPRYAKSINKLTHLLLEHQKPDGSWSDRWHASPYYATASCVLALEEFGSPDSPAAVRRAVGWVLDTQRADGSWGLWSGTREETAYALQILLKTGSMIGPEPDPRCVEAAARGYLFLVGSADQVEDPPLWHDKDLYLPVAVVRAAVLASCHLAQRHPAVVERVTYSP